VAVGREAKEMLGRTPGNVVGHQADEEAVIAISRSQKDADLFPFRKRTTGACWCIANRHRRAERNHSGGKTAVQDSALSRTRQRVFSRRAGHGRGDWRGLPIEEPLWQQMVVDIGRRHPRTSRSSP